MSQREEVKFDSPNSSAYPLGISSSNVTPSASPLNSSHKSKTNFRFLQSKILDEANNDNDIQLDIESDSGPGYFDQDSEDQQDETIFEEKNDKISRKKTLWKKECNGYELYFKLEVFFQFLFMHVLFYFLLGPFIVILSPIVGTHVLRNQYFWGFNKFMIRQSLEFLAIISFLVIFNATDTKGLEAMEVYMMVIAVLIRLVTISSKYAYQSDSFLKQLYKKTLTPGELINKLFYLPRWRLQEDKTIEEELKTATLRLEMDSPLFFFTFLGKASPELLGKLSNKKDGAGDIESQRKEGEISVTPSRRLSITDIPATTERMMTIRVTNDGPAETLSIEMKKVSGKRRTRKTQNTVFAPKTFSQFLPVVKLESKALSGASLASDLVKHARIVRYKNLKKFSILLGVIRALIPTLYRAYEIIHEDKDIPLFTDKPYIVIIIFFINAFFFQINTLVLIIVVEDMKTKIFCLKQIGYLISPKKLSYLKDRKLYPTLNIFDPLTLRTWSNFRKLMNNYGKKFILRNNFNVTVSMTFYFFVIATLLLQTVGIIESYNDTLFVIIFTFDSIVFFTIFIVNMWGAAFINDQYKVHKNLLKKNKTIISDFQRLSNLYVGEHAIEPDNPIYKEGLKLLKQELGEDNFEEKLIARAENLASIIDDIIEDLDFEEKNEPFTVMGVVVHYSLLKSMAVAVASLVFAIAQSYLN